MGPKVLCSQIFLVVLFPVLFEICDGKNQGVPKGKAHHQVRENN